MTNTTNTINTNDIKVKVAALARLWRGLADNETVYTVHRHTSRSGMLRRIDIYIIRDNQPVLISRDVAEATGMTLAKEGGIVVRGCGMDMGWHVVSRLALEVFGNTSNIRHSWL